MRKIFFPSILLAIILLLCACGISVKMVGSWMDDSRVGYSVDNVLVIGVSRDEIARHIWENTFTELLEKENIKAQANNIVMGGQVIEPDRQMIMSAVQKSGAETVLITRVVNTETEKKTRSGFVQYEPVPYYSYLGDYYGFVYRAVYTPPEEVEERTVWLESAIYDVASEKLVWTAQTEVVNAKLLKTDFAKIVNLLLDDLRKKKLI